MDKEKINYINHIEWLLVFVTLIGGFYLMDGKHDYLNSRFDQFMIACHEESKDFHGRLIIQDIEFKAKLAEQDKEYKAKIAEQDREYKFHLYHFHGQ